MPSEYLFGNWGFRNWGLRCNTIKTTLSTQLSKVVVAISFSKFTNLKNAKHYKRTSLKIQFKNCYIRTIKNGEKINILVFFFEFRIWVLLELDEPTRIEGNRGFKSEEFQEGQKLYKFWHNIKLKFSIFHMNFKRFFKPHSIIAKVWLTKKDSVGRNISVFF